MSVDLVSRIVPHRAQAAPRAIALIEDERRWTYEELASLIRSAAERLSRAGVRAGDRVLLVCETCCAAVAFYFACTSTNAWPVVLGARLTIREIDEIRRHCGARLVLFAGSAVVARRMQSEDCAFQSAEFAGSMLLIGHACDSAAIEPAAERESDNVAALIYTTGTTGSPKGVMLTHANLMFVAQASATARRLSARDRILAVLPMSHILGLTGVLLGGLLSGAEIHLQRRFDPDMLLTALEREALTVMIGTPAMYAMLGEYARRKGRAPVKAPALRLISTAGAPLDLATKAATEELFRLPLHNGYGMTECAPTITLSDPDLPPRDCTIGRLLPGLEARLVGSSGNAPENGEPGELWVRGPGVMKGYYRAQEETARVLDAEGWFRTGDLATVAGGNYYLSGRIKEMIIRFGYKVYPAEVESVLNAHPEVSCSAVLHGCAGNAEDIVAFVQLREGTFLTESELTGFAAKRLAPYKRPSKVIIVDRMPLSPTGKILKVDLAARLG